MTIAVDWDVKNQTKNLMWVLGFLFISSVILLGILQATVFSMLGIIFLRFLETVITQNMLSQRSNATLFYFDNIFV